jgi:hypothetical protein
MSKNYYLNFGSGDPSANTGLSPTFLIFSVLGVTAVTPPGITETPAGSGLYGFSYGPTQSILFKVDGGAALATADRYIASALDPVQAVDERIGVVSDSFGSTNVDPTTLFGLAKRAQEFQEGNSVFNKATAVWDVYSRGSSTLLMEKVLTNTTTSSTKT